MLINGATINGATINGATSSGSGPTALNASAPILISRIAWSGHAEAPISMAVRWAGSVSAPIRMVLSSGDAITRPEVRVLMDEVDVTARLTGQLIIEAEEDCARLADFDLVPIASGVNPISLTGQTVKIDFLVDNVPIRLFTGWIDKPVYDPVNGVLKMQCTDDLINVLGALTVDQITALVGGYYSISVSGEVADHYDYAKARLASRSASLDLDAYGVPRLTEWSGLPTFQQVTDADHLDGTIQVDVADRADIRNEIRITLQYRYCRLRDRRAVIGWSALGALTATMQQLGWQYPTLSTLSSAAGGSGWNLVSASYVMAPATVSVDIGGVTYYKDIPAGSVDGWVARMAQRHVQTITEKHVVTVTAPRSVEANGVLSETLQASASSSYDGTTWESDLTAMPELIDGEIDWAPDIPRTGVAPVIPVVGSLTGGPYATTGSSSTCSGTSDALSLVDTFENVSKTMLAQANRRILASHRSGRVHLTLLIKPTLDLNTQLGIDTARVQASGKVAKFKHVIDLSTASATTEVSLAILGAGGVGVVTPTPLDALPQPESTIPEQDWLAELPGLSTWVGGVDAYTDNIMGWLVNCPQTISMYKIVDGQRIEESITSTGYTANGLPVTGFRIGMPGVSDCNRNAAVLTSISDFVVDFTDDTLALYAT